MRIGALPGLGCGLRFACRRDDDEELGDGREDARFVADDEQRAEGARRQSGDESETDVAGLDRETLTGFGQAEDDELRRERQEEEAQPAAGGRQTSSAGQSRQRHRRKRRDRQEQ